MIWHAYFHPPITNLRADIANRSRHSFRRGLGLLSAQAAMSSTRDRPAS